MLKENLKMIEVEDRGLQAEDEDKPTLNQDTTEDTVDHIFTFFRKDDAETLQNASQVCTTWHNLARNQHRFNMAPGRAERAGTLLDHIMYNEIDQALKLMKRDRWVLMVPSEYKANPDSPSSQIMTPLQYAIKYGFTPLVEACKAMMSDQDIQQQEAELKTWEVPRDKSRDEDAIVDTGSSFSFAALLTLAQALIKNPNDQQTQQNYVDALTMTPSWLLITADNCYLKDIDPSAKSFDFWSLARGCGEWVDVRPPAWGVPGVGGGGRPLYRMWERYGMVVYCPLYTY